MLSNHVNTYVSDFQSHPIRTVIGTVGITIAFSIVALGTCNVHRAYNNEPTYTMTDFLIHADSHSQSEIRYANKNDNKNAYKEQREQANKIRQAHIEKATSNLNKIGLKHGVDKITYNPKNHHFNVHFKDANPTNYQRKYAQKLCNTAND